MYKKLPTITPVYSLAKACLGGSLVRPEATGFGAVYFVQEMMATRKDTMQGKKIAVSGFGNVAWGAVKKLDQLGAKVITLSGPDGYVYDKEGISGNKIDYLLELRASNEDIIEPYARQFKSGTFVSGKDPEVPVISPCRVPRNELDQADAQTLVNNK
jgi:glutamate dehydrogenase (NADP+)